MRKPKNYWTKEICQEEALKYNTKKEYSKKSSGSYKKAYAEFWLNDICSHMIEIRKEKNYWTKEKCHEEALKYNTRYEFRKMSCSAYGISITKKWMNDICSHMIKIKNEKEYWTKEQCQEESLKYKTRVEYSKKNSASYCKSWQKGWLNDICSHMLSVGNKYEFLDTKTVYVGLTFNLNERNEQHSKRGPVFIYSQNNKITSFIQLTEYIEVKWILL